MTQERLLQKVASVMLIADFEVSDRFSMRPRSFDMIARRGTTIIVIKVVSHIDSASDELAADLDQVAISLKGSPLIIGERARDGDLERGTVYLRYGIYAVSISTLHDFFVENVPPLIYASPGGLYVNIGGNALREAREAHNLSLGDLGQLLGVSRRAISKYESGMSTSVDIAIRLEEIFEQEVIEPIDLLRYSSRLRPGEKETLSNGTMAFLCEIGVELQRVRRAPFQVLITWRNHAILTAYGTSQKVVKRATLIGNLSKITKTHAMCVTTDEVIRKRIGQTLVVWEEQLHEIEDGDALIAMVDE